MANDDVRFVDQGCYATYSTGMIAACYVSIVAEAGEDEPLAQEYAKELKSRGIAPELLTGGSVQEFQEWWEHQLQLQYAGRPH